MPERIRADRPSVGEARAAVVGSIAALAPRPLALREPSRDDPCVPRTIRILVTGFEPFGGSSVNPSREVLAPLAATRWGSPPWHRAGAPALEILTALLPVVGGTEAGSAAAALRAAVDSAHAGHRTIDALLCLGETGSRDGVCVERFAVNEREYRIPDNAGASVRGEPVIAGAPAQLGSTLPVDDLVRAVGAEGVRAEASTNAGRFLCNEIMFHALAIAAAPGSRIRRAGFVHVPQLPEQIGDKPGRTGMTFDQTLRGIRAIVAHLALLDSDA